MISIIVCSVKAENLSALKFNIEETIGVPYQLISIDNSKTGYGICDVYNSGAKQAQYPVLCFVHEDVKFETPDWGKKVCTHLADKDTGLIGLAGGDTKGPLPTSWSVSVVSNEINIIQHYKNALKDPEHILKTGLPNAVKRKVVALDGVLLATRKDVFQKFQFDEKTFKGFHGYDIDYSLQVGTQYNLCVVFDIVVRHYSEGNPDKSWMESAFLVSKKWKTRLPVSVHALPASEKNFYYWRSMQIFLQRLFELNYPWYRILFYYTSFSISKYFKLQRFLSMGKYVILNSVSEKIK